MRIAILEDDPQQSELVADWLREAGHDVHAFATGRDFMRVVARESFDLCLLDSVLPDLSGQDVLRWARQDRGDETPMIFVTARDAEEDVVAALAGGADDYIVKPVRQRELVARLEAVMRRARPPAPRDVLEAGPYRFDLSRKVLAMDGEAVKLTDREFELAAFLFRNVGRLISRGHLLEAVWGRSPAVATRTIDTHVSRLRFKLQLKPERGFRLTPTYSYGYRLERVDTEAGSLAESS